MTLAVFCPLTAGRFVVPTVQQVLTSLPPSHAMCVACLVERTGFRSDEVSRQLESLGEATHSATEGGCVGCPDPGGPIFRLAR